MKQALVEIDFLFEYRGLSVLINRVGKLIKAFEVAIPGC